MPAQKAKCSKCNRTKRRGLFHRDRSKKNGLSSYCKACKKKSDSKRTGKYGDRDNEGNYIYTVYYLPEEHYVGMTKDLMQRMRDHKKKGKIVEGYEVVARFTSAKQAHLMETRLHIMGYHGFHYTA
jgi:hypothetical protein